MHCLWTVFVTAICFLFLVTGFQVLEGVIYYVDPITSSNVMNAFVGSKERVRTSFIGKALLPFSSPEPTILLACGRNRELWEQPFQACAIDADYVRPDGQNSVISFVISKWLLPELSIPAAGQKDRRLWGREC